MDFASLGIRIDSSQAKEAFNNLKSLSDAGDRAEKSVGKIGASGKSAGAGLSEADKAAKSASKSIDDYIKKTQIAAVTNGFSARETKLYELAVLGASKAQLQAADSAIRLNEGYERGLTIGRNVGASLATIGKAAVLAGAGLIAVSVGFEAFIKRAGDFQDLAEKTGDSAQNIASLAVAAGTTGTAMDTVSAASIKLTKGLTGVDDESKTAGAAISALGLNIADFKRLAPADQFETVAKAMSKFKDGTEKTAVALALFGRSGAEILPFLKELGAEGGRQYILTGEQIKAADDFTDAQAKLRSQMSLTASGIATQAIPAYTALTSSLIDALEAITGIASASQSLSKSTAVKDFAESAAIGLAVLADGAFFVAQAFRYLGDNLAATAANAVALATLDFSGATAIAKASNDFNESLKFSLGLADRVREKFVTISSITKGISASYSNEGRNNGLKALDFDGPEKKAKTDNGRSEAKARLRLQLEDIKSAGDILASTYANSERLLEAQKQAGLVIDAAYYSSKKSLIEGNTKVKIKELQDENDIRNAQKLNTADGLERDREVMKNKAKITELQQKSVNDVEILGIQESAAYKKVTDAIIDAKNAAQDYLDVTSKRFDREIEGLGKGNLARERDAQRDSTNDKFVQQRTTLARDKDSGKITERQYNDELQIIENAHQDAMTLDEKYFSDKADLQKSYNKGASEALQNYYDESQNIYKQTEKVVVDAFQGMEDALVGFVKTGKLDFKSLADSIIADVARIIVRQQITGPLAASISGGISGGSGIGGLISSFFGGLFGRDSGGPVSAGGMYRVNENRPELLNVSGKQYLMMGNSNGSVSANQGGSQPINVVQNFTVGDVASVSMVRQSVANSERRIAAAIGRSQNYGGVMA